MNIVWSPLALERVAEYAEHIALDNPQAAMQWAEKVFAKVAPLADFPKTGRIVPELEREDIREVFHGHYRVIYRIDRSIFVLTVRHSRQLLAAADFEEKA